MVNPIQLKRSDVPGRVPTSATLVAGELAANTADGRLFLKKDDGTVVDITSIPGIAGLTEVLVGKVGSDDPRLSDAREWSAETVAQAEAEAGAATTRRAWTSQRVRQAIAAWWDSVSSAWGRGFVSSADAAAGRTALGLADAVHEAPDDGISYMRRGKSWVAGGGGLMPVNNLGTVTVPDAGVSVGIDVAAHEFSHMSIATSGFVGVLTVNFTNIPDTTNGYFVWYVQFLRGGLRTVNFTLPAGTLRWAGGVAPAMSSTAGTRDVIMFERQVGSQNVTATHIAQGLI